MRDALAIPVKEIDDKCEERREGCDGRKCLEQAHAACLGQERDRCYRNGRKAQREDIAKVLLETAVDHFKEGLDETASTLRNLAQALKSGEI